MDDLLPEFIVETRETLQAVAGALVAWEAAPADRALLDQIFRFVHTVKGSCGFLDLPRLQRLSHSAEDVLSEVRSGLRTPDVGFVSAVLAIVDRIGVLTEALESGEAIADDDEPALIAALSASAAAPIVAVPAEAAAVPKPRGTGPRAPSRTIRLPVDLLDRMMASVSDMVLVRNELAHSLASGTRAGGSAFERLTLCVGELREAVTRARMARIDGLFAPLPRLIRDLALELGKQVRLELAGGEVELDREMIEMIRDPLLHVVRNAIDHGVESASARLAAGKPAEGCITIGARQSGSRILIEVADDGNGIDTGRLVSRAMEAGVIGPAEAAALDHPRALDLIFHPGLSTAAKVTAISGRGVGMDVVRSNLERLGGSVSVDSRIGAGVRLTLQVPLTLTIIPALVVACGDQQFAIARAQIDEIVRPGGAVALQRIGGGLHAIVRNARLPVADMRAIAGGDAAAAPALLVILRTPAGGRYALAVDGALDHEELVIKPAAPAIMASGLFAGTTLPDDSRPMLLIDVGGVAKAAGVTPCGTPVQEAEPESKPVIPTLLFRDLDGAERAVRLGEVDRIEEVGRVRVVESGGRRLLMGEGILAPLHACVSLDGHDRVRVLRLRGGTFAYAVDQVIDVLPMAEEVFASLAEGAIAGVLVHEGRAVELIDVPWLVAQQGAVPAGQQMVVAPTPAIAGGDAVGRGPRALAA